MAVYILFFIVSDISVRLVLLVSTRLNLSIVSKKASGEVLVKLLWPPLTLVKSDQFVFEFWVFGEGPLF